MPLKAISRVTGHPQPRILELGITAYLQSLSTEDRRLVARLRKRHQW